MKKSKKTGEGNQQGASISAGKKSKSGGGKHNANTQQGCRVGVMGK